MKIIIYFLNFAFSKYFTDGIRTKDEKRDLPNVHDEVHEHMQNMIKSNSDHVINKRSRIEKRFEPTGWLTSMMTGAISKSFAASSKGLRIFWTSWRHRIGRRDSWRPVS